MLVRYIEYSPSAVFYVWRTEVQQLCDGFENSGEEMSDRLSKASGFCDYPRNNLAKSWPLKSE